MPRRVDVKLSFGAELGGVVLVLEALICRHSSAGTHHPFYIRPSVIFVLSASNFGWVHIDARAGAIVEVGFEGG